MDAIVALAAFGFLIFSFFKIGWWRWFWIAQAVLLGGFELGAKIVTGKTISQQFWAFYADNTAQGTLALVTLGTLAAGLIVHLMWKKIKEWREK